MLNSKKLDRALIGLGSASGLLTLVMIVLITPDVVTRKLFSYTIPGVTEVNIVLLVCMVFLGLAGAQARNAHFNLTVFTELMPRSMQRLCRILSLAIFLAFGLFLTWATTQHAITSVQRGEYMMGLTKVPIWPARCVVAFGLGLLSLQVFVQLLRAVFCWTEEE